jgi:SAM-dependent methyltransferase
MIQPHMSTTLFTKSERANYWNDLYQRPSSLFEHTMSQRRDYATRFILEHFDRNVRILDLGCGAGVLSEQLLAHGYQVTCADASQDMLDLASQRLQRYPSAKYRLVHADIMNLPFESGEFDVVVCLGVFGYFDAVNRALSEVRRVLEPGGTFFMSVRNRYNLQLTDLGLLPTRAARLLAERVRAYWRPATPEDFRIRIHERPGPLIRGVERQGYSLVLFDGLGYGPLRAFKKDLLAPDRSIRFSDALDGFFRRTGLQRASRWMADVSFYVFRSGSTRGQVAPVVAPPIFKGVASRGRN